jgi:hypothetical protein
MAFACTCNSVEKTPPLLTNFAFYKRPYEGMGVVG